MMSLWDALRMNMMISYQELVRTFLIEYKITAWTAIVHIEKVGCNVLFIIRYQMNWLYEVQNT
ncbi:TPA: hypothetical protein ACQ7ZK_004566, partial [Escherichia coli]